MSTNKHIDRICIIITLIALVLTALFMNGEKLGIAKVVDEDAEKYSDLSNFTANDQNGDWESEDAAVITLNGDNASVSGNGAYVNGSTVVITNAGTYAVSGTLNDGFISVDAYDSSKVWIKLDGVNITSSDNACIRVEEADKVFLTLAEGSENFLTSGSEMSEAALADGTGGAIFARDDLTINGSGSLTITAAYKHGIDANDDLIITGGTISVTALKDGLHANDSLRIMNTDLTVNAEDDGLAVANEGGYLVIDSGTIRITSGDDAIHTGGDITVNGGTLTISAGDDGIHSDTNVLINDGTILISECYEGIEAHTIELAGGDVTIQPTDDGLNANGGSNSFGMPGGMGRGGWGQSTETPAETPAAGSEDEETWVHISGGSLTIINENARDADGIDSNGDLYISGGTIRVSLPGGGSNNAIDFGSESGGKAIISGGNLAAAGGAQMLENFDESSEQPVIMYNLTETMLGRTEVRVLDAEGKEILSYTPAQSFNAIFLSCPEMEVGETYTVIIGETEETLTIDSDAVTVGSSAMGGGMGRGGRGGNRFRSTETTEGEMPQFDGAMMPGPGRMTPSDGQGPEFDGTSMPQNEGMGGPGKMMPPEGQMSEFDGTMPPPDQMPGREGTGSEKSGTGGPMGSREFEQHQEAEDEEEPTVSAAKSLSEFGTETWILIGASILVLAASLLFALMFKRR